MPRAGPAKRGLEPVHIRSGQIADHLVQLPDVGRPLAQARVLGADPLVEITDVHVMEGVLPGRLTQQRELDRHVLGPMQGAHHRGDRDLAMLGVLGLAAHVVAERGPRGMGDRLGGRGPQARRGEHPDDEHAFHTTYNYPCRPKFRRPHAATLSQVKTEIHPEYVEAHVRCTCGNEFTTRSTKPEIHVEICSACHPFYTGKQKLVDTGGRVERFQRRVAKGRRPSRDTNAGA